MVTVVADAVNAWLRLVAQFSPTMAGSKAIGTVVQLPVVSVYVPE